MFVIATKRLVSCEMNPDAPIQAPAFREGSELKRDQ